MIDINRMRKAHYIYVSFEKHITHGKCKNKRCGVCNMIIEGKSYTFEKPKKTFIINRNLTCN